MTACTVDVLEGGSAMTGPVTRPSAQYGVHSEVGQLRKVLVCAPGLAHERLTPSNRDGLLFDEVMWVQNARRDHLDFMTKMRDRGIDVVELHDLLSATLTIPEAKAWLLDRKIVPNEVGLGLVEGTRAFLESLAPRALAEYMIGGLSTFDLPEEFRSSDLALARESRGMGEYLMPPLPNTLYTRDTTCWIYGGVTLNPLYWPARQGETLLMKAIYTFHPDFIGATTWWGDPEQNWGLATLEGGDVMPIGNGAVIVGMGERSSRQAITQLAATLFADGAADRVIVASLPRLRSAMHLDTVITFVDRDCVTAYREIVDAIQTFTLRPGDKTPIDVIEEFYTRRSLASRVQVATVAADSVDVELAKATTVAEFKDIVEKMGLPPAAKALAQPFDLPIPEIPHDPVEAVNSTRDAAEKAKENLSRALKKRKLGDAMDKVCHNIWRYE
jgi:arginine deiminase